MNFHVSTFVGSPRSLTDHLRQKAEEGLEVVSVSPTITANTYLLVLRYLPISATPFAKYAHVCTLLQQCLAVIGTTIPSTIDNVRILRHIEPTLRTMVTDLEKVIAHERLQERGWLGERLADR
jgi:hypothetical protein